MLVVTRIVFEALAGKGGGGELAINPSMYHGVHVSMECRLPRSGLFTRDGCFYFNTMATEPAAEISKWDWVSIWGFRLWRLVQGLCFECLEV